MNEDTWFNPLPVLTPGNDGGRSRKSLSRAFAAGDLVRVRHGFYVATDQWLAATSAQRFMTTVKAVAGRLHQPVFAGATSLVLQGIPVLETPATVDVITSTASRAGIQTTMPGYHEIHARHSGELPYIHRTRNIFREPPYAVNEPRVPQLHTALRLLDVVDHLAETLTELDFCAALAVVDSLLSGRNGNGLRFDRSRLKRVLDRDTSPSGRAILNRVLRWSTHLSESPGESLSRARMIELGFQMPELQAHLSGADGVEYRVDFWWEELGLIGESDGWGKYSAGDGRADPEQVVRLEKRREDALRERGYRFLRWDWADALDPQRFAELLVRNGVPRRRRASIRWSA
ncbi:hypothetical protein [Citricoccus sp. GCM10030269]|uniref:hypothetical protein n=1 Tax=Citricoccus sp. GCM10030269 TaxID=3273388 RepID=UPI0036081E7F